MLTSCVIYLKLSDYLGFCVDYRVFLVVFVWHFV